MTAGTHPYPDLAVPPRPAEHLPPAPRHIGHPRPAGHAEPRLLSPTGDATYPVVAGPATEPQPAARRRSPPGVVALVLAILLCPIVGWQAYRLERLTVQNRQL